MAYQGERPRLGREVFVAPTARVIGRVELGDGSSVWFGAVVRGDVESIRVGPGTNLQDNCVLHADVGLPLEVGRDCLVGHGAVLHSCRVEDDCLVGINAVVLNGARVGRGSLVGAGAVVPEGVNIPPGSLAVGVPARVVRPVTPAEAQFVRRGVDIYRRLAAAYLSGPEGSNAFTGEGSATVTEDGSAAFTDGGAGSSAPSGEG